MKKLMITILQKFKNFFTFLSVTFVLALAIFLLLDFGLIINVASATTFCEPELEECYTVDDGINQTVNVGSSGEWGELTRQTLQALNEQKTQTNITNVVNASQNFTCGITEVGCWIIKAIDYVVTGLIYVPLTIAEGLLDSTIDTNINTDFANTAFVSVGWRVVRDVANMFFVFILLWIALATIFNLEPYTARQLLPRLIVAAILMNFSLPIGMLVTNTANALGNVFWQQMLADGGVADTFVGMSNIQVVINSQPPPTVTTSIKSMDDLWQVPLNVQNYKLVDCITRPGEVNAFAQDNVFCKKKLAEFAPAAAALGLNLGRDAEIAAYAKSIMWKIVTLPVLTFVLLAGAIFMMIRLVSLTLILIFGPLVFLFMALPYTQHFYNQWWDRLIRWSFFMPAYLFLLFLSSKTAPTLLTATIRGNTSNQLNANLQYMLVIVLLIACLLVANQMGIAFAGTVIGWGRRAAFGARRAAVRGGLRLGARGAGAAAKPIMETKAMQWLASKPGLRVFTKPFEAAISAKTGVEEERARVLEQAMRTAPAGYAAARFKGERAKVQEAYLKRAGEKDIQKLEKGLGKEEMSKLGLQMAVISPGLEKRIASAVEGDELKAALNKKVHISSPDFDRAYKEFMDEQTVGQLREIANKDNIRGSERLQKYLLERGSEKEIEALTKNGEQLLALREVFQRWTNEALTNPTSTAGKGMRDMIAYLQTRGATLVEAKAEVKKSMQRGDFLEPVLKERGANDKIQKWAGNVPIIKIVIGEGRIFGRREEDFEDLVKRLERAGVGGAAPPAGGTPPAGGGGGTTP